MKFLSLKSIAFFNIALVLMLLLSACSFSLPKIGGAQPAQTGTPENSATDTADPGSEEAPSTPVKTETSASSGQPANEAEITAQDFNDPENPPHGLILFTSIAELPFKDMGIGAISNPGAERYLWAISTDGKRAGRVSPEGSGSALFVPEAAGKKSKVIANGFQLASEQIQPVEMPEKCAGEGNQTCSGFQFSPSGNMLAYFSGQESCWRKLTLYDLAGRKQVNTWEKAHWAYFFKNGSLILALGDCELQHVYLYYPNTGKQTGVADVGKEFWNPNHTAVLYQVQGKPELQSVLWGFNLEASRVFLWPSKETVIEDTPIWLADGESFVYQHQAYKYDKSTKDAILNSTRQVILMNSSTRSQRLLGYDSRSNYHLCSPEQLPEGAPGSPCEQDHGNWLRVLRLPFKPARFPAAEQKTPAARCGLYGLSCEDKAEVLALDWQTGKQTPWEEAQIPDATATPGAQRPDLAKEPFYQDSAGEFALYLGQGGKTLWYVPRGGEPALWVQDGENFAYLP